jgi:hypothetical protein
MAHERFKKAEVRRRFVVDRQPLAACATAAGVSYSTARAWKKDAAERGDDWDRARLAEQVSDGGVQELTRIVLAEFVPLFESTIIELKDSKIPAIQKAEAISRLSDAYTKTVKASGAVDPAIARLAWAMDVLKLLAQFVASNFPQHNDAMLEILEPFGVRLAEEFGT